MDVQFNFHLENSPLSLDLGYERLGKLLAALKPVLPDIEWYVSPSDARESAKPWIPFTDRERFMERARRRHEGKISDYPGHSSSFDAILSSAKDASAFKVVPGRASLEFYPGLGDITLEILEPEKAWPDRNTTACAISVLRAVVLEEWVEFASTDVREPRKTAKGSDGYSREFRTFPHRRFLGWMGFVQRLPPLPLITAKDVPEADEVIPLPGRCGSLIVAVKEKFDLHDPYHIMRAQKVEMRLVDLDALPVIDPNFM